MMKHNILILLIALFIPAQLVLAQTSKNLGQSDPDAKALLDAVSAKFKSFKSVKADFTLTIQNGAGKVQGTKKGTLYMKGVKYHVTLSGQEIFCDGKNIWTFDKSANEVQVAEFDPSSSLITPQKLFTNFYDKDFLYKMNDEKKQGSKTLQVVELTPVDKTKPFFKVVIDVDKASRIIMNTQVFEKNGNRYLYSVNSIATNQAVADDLFVFDPKQHPGVEVIDLR